MQLIEREYPPFRVSITFNLLISTFIGGFIMYFYICVITFQLCICVSLGSLCCYFRSLHDHSIVLFILDMMRVLRGVNLVEMSECTYLSSLFLSPISRLLYYSHCITLLYFEIIIINKETCLCLKKKTCSYTTKSRSLWNVQRIKKTPTRCPWSSK